MLPRLTMLLAVGRLAVGLLPLGAGCGDGGGGGATSDAPPSADATTACSSEPGWSAAPPVGGGAVQETAAVALAGKVYVLGGFDGSIAVVDSVRIFDPATCAWSSGPPLPRAVHHANAAVVDGTIYVLGSMATGNFTAIGDVWAWRPASETSWSTRASMPAGTQRGSAVVGAIDGVIYVAGGLRNGAVATVSSYTPATDTWDSELPALPQINDHGCGGVVAGKLYVTGGRRGTPASRSALVFEYAPGGVWVARASMPTARGGTACGVIDDRIIVVGGEGNPATPSGVFAEVEAYTPAADRWDTLTPMISPRHGMGAAASGGALHVPGGATTELFGAVDIHEVLRP